MLTSFTQRQNRSFHFMESVRMAAKCIIIKSALAKCAKLLFFIVKYAKLWRSCCRPLLVCWNSLLSECFFERVSKCTHYFALCAGTQWLVQFCFSLAENCGDKFLGQSLPTTKKNNKKKIMRDFFDAILWNCSVLSDPSQGGTRCHDLFIFFYFIPCSLLIKPLVSWNKLRFLWSKNFCAVPLFPKNVFPHIYHIFPHICLLVLPSIHSKRNYNRKQISVPFILKT